MKKVKFESGSAESVFDILKKGLFSYINDRLYMIALIITAIGSYGFLVTHYSVSIDDLDYDRYYYGELIAQGRLSATIFHRFFGITDNYIWIDDFLGILFMCIGVMLLCIIFDQFVSTPNRIPQMIFSCIFVSYPLHSELFSYSGCSIAVGLGLVLVAVSLLFTIQHIKTKNVFYLIFSIAALFFVTSWYESLLFIYVGMVFSIFLLKQTGGEKYKLKQLISEGIRYAIPVFIAVVSEFVVSNAIRLLMHLEKSTNAATDLGLGMYVKYGIMYHIENLIKPVLSAYVVSSAFYFPITILAIAAIIMCIIIIADSIKKRCLCLSLCEVFMLLLLIGLTPVLYCKQPYRTCQYYAFFVAFEAFFLLIRVSKSNMKKITYRICCVLLILLATLQISKINYYFTNDYLRYECEKSTMQAVGYELEKSYDLSKPVVFVGKYEFPKEIKNRIEIDRDSRILNCLKKTGIFDLYCTQPIKIDQSYSIQDTNCQSYINWSEESFGGTGRSLIKFLQFLGYDGIKEPTKEQVDDAKASTVDMPSWPQEGSIADRGDYVVVKLSNNQN